MQRRGRWRRLARIIPGVDGLPRARSQSLGIWGGYGGDFRNADFRNNLRKVAFRFPFIFNSLQIQPNNPRMSQS